MEATTYVGWSLGCQVKIKFFISNSFSPPLIHGSSLAPLVDFLPWDYEGALSIYYLDIPRQSLLNSISGNGRGEKGEYRTNPWRPLSCPQPKLPKNRNNSPDRHLASLALVCVLLCLPWSKVRKWVLDWREPARVNCSVGPLKKTMLGHLCLSFEAEVRVPTWWGAMAAVNMSWRCASSKIMM